MSIRMFTDERKRPLIHHVQIKPLETSIHMSQGEAGSIRYDITRKVTAQILDMQDKAIVDAIVQCARENGVDDIWLLDKEFVLDALREKIERERAVRPFLCDERDVSGLLEED